MRYHVYLILPAREKYLGTIHAPDMLTALDLACAPSEGILARVARDTAVTCCDDTIRVERVK